MKSIYKYQGDVENGEEFSDYEGKQANYKRLRELMNKNYDEFIRKVVPAYEDCLTSVVGAIVEEPITVIDIGCGTGELLCSIIRKVPTVKCVVGVDKNGDYLGDAHRRLMAFGNISSIFIQGDFLELTLPIADLCVSSLALSGLENKYQRELLKKLVASYPMFINYTPIKSGDQTYHQEREEYIKEFLENSGGDPEATRYILSEIKLFNGLLTLDEHRRICEEGKARFELIEHIPGFVIYRAQALSVLSS